MLIQAQTEPGTRNEHAPPVLAFGTAAGLGAPSRFVMRHLVQSRYSAAAAGDPAWGQRTLAEVHAAAGGPHPPSADRTYAVLVQLVADGFATAELDASGETVWSATPAGVSAFEGLY
jgi:hypothetical protein